MRALGLAAALAAALAAPARANWEYTHWGMTEEAVIAAANGAAQALPPARHRFMPDARMAYRVEGGFQEGLLRLRVAFGFDTVTGGLVCVSYATDQPAQAPLLRDWITRRYGRPTQAARDPASREQTFTWREPDNIDLQIIPNRGAIALHCARGT